MKVGVCCAGLGPASTGDFIRRSAQAAERAGFASFWMPEHIVFFTAYPESEYPYKGVMEVDATALALTSIAETIVAMSWAAAATNKMEIGSNVVIIPQRNPLLLAKQLSTLDQLADGRVVLGAGVGWAKEEYEAVGVDWPNRGKRMDEYIDVMRALWRKENATTFKGETIAFKDAYMHPKPARDIPIVMGGESPPALRRIARVGDGWFPFNIPPAEAKAKIANLKKLVKEQGRDPESLRYYAPIFPGTTKDDLERYREAGVTELYLVLTGVIPIEDVPMRAMMTEMGQKFVEAVAGW